LSAQVELEAIMTPGERLVGSLPMKELFYDAHERRSYLRAVEIAKRLVDDPSLVARGKEFLERFSRRDPHQTAAYRKWSKILRDAGPEEIARMLLQDSAEGAELRETAPVFVVIHEQEARRLWV
jgi:hypothetical protein